MPKVNRVPACIDFSVDGMRRWFAELSRQDLLFHPDDDPAEIVSIGNGAKTFSEEEVNKLRKVLNKMFSLNGDEVYEAAYPAFASCMEIRQGA
jgi:hypothetical protein